jgi:TPR repeat protein
MATRLRLWRLLFLCLLAACSRAPQGGPATDQFQQGTEAMERGDYAEAYCAWRPLAEQGDAQAQYNLGWFYANGYGVQVNPTKAVDWWQRAGDQGHIEAQFALGMMYASGDGMEPDLSRAIPWLLKAARQGHEDARDVLRKSLRENPEQLGEILPLLADQEWLGSQREVKGDKTNARAGPGTDHAVVTTLDKGARVQEIARSGSWVLVLLRQPLALVWIHSRLLQ